jgi:2-hydroxy-4-carboxymuconate semialdehyde hemiacetal dehydrogenase
LVVAETLTLRHRIGAERAKSPEERMKIVMVGQGAFGQKHLDGLKNIDGVEVASLVGGNQESTAAVAKKYGIPHCTSDLGEALAQPGVEAAILTSPTQVHASQAEQVMRAGKHVEIEIPIADSLADSRKIAATQKATGKIAMAGHTRRFNPSHQWVHKRIKAGELTLQHLVVQTFFFRRKNINLEGKPRSWTDHLLWHHACHTVDLFHHQTGEVASQVSAMQGPIHPELKIALDMSIQMRVPSGALCTLALSFNNDGPQGTFFRYICDNGTYIARYDDLFDGKDKQIDLKGVDVSMNGIELQDREFVAAIREKREPHSSVAQVLPAMEVLDRLEKCFG